MINPDIKKTIEYIKKKYGPSGDLVTRFIKIKRQTICYCFLESVSSDDKISDFFMKYIGNYIKRQISFNNLYESLKNAIPNSNLSTVNNYEDIFYKLASGFTCIFVDGTSEVITIETRSTLDRGVTEATSENIVRGPKDSFTENHQKNLGLIRKRIKDPNLWFKDVTVGRRTKTKVSVAYIKDVSNLKLVDNIIKQLKKIDIDGILDSGYIREFLLKDSKSVFPRFHSTERPDLACMSLLEGKIVILVENSPFVLLIPGLFIDFLHSPEDNYQKAINIDLTRIIRTLSFFITVMFPGIYVALTTFNPEIIPDELLISLAIQRGGVPFPTSLEILVMIITFEILRESDVRIPNASGAAIGIVGALVLGEAAVTAGIVSPIVIIVIGLTSISGLLFTEVDFVNGIRWWRFIFLIASSIMGVVGFVVCLIIFIAKLCSLEYFGISYLAPFAPYFKHQNAILRKPLNKIKERPSFLSKNRIRMRDNNEEN